MRIRQLGRLAAIGLLVCIGSASASAQTTHVVTTSGFDFVPQDITIQVGDSIMWTGLQAGAFHNVAETDCPASIASFPNGGFTSGAVGAVPDYTLQFTSVGTSCFICEPHIGFGMFGSVTVIPAASASIPTMGEWGLILMGVLMLGFGSYRISRSRAASANQ